MIQSSVEWQLYQGAFQLIMTTFGSCTVDLFAFWLNAQLKHFVSWRPDTNTIGTDGLKLPWDKWTAYAFPPFCLIRRCPKIRHGTGSPNMEVLAMVSSPTGALDRSPSDSTRGPRAADGPLRQPTSISGIWKLSGTDTWQREFQEKLPNCWLLDRAPKQTLHTKSAWKRWNSWCTEREVDPLSCPIQPFIEFLTGLFKRDYNSVRSILSDRPSP